jgi:hypothetical protein
MKNVAIDIKLKLSKRVKASPIPKPQTVLVNRTLRRYMDRYLLEYMAQDMHLVILDQIREQTG